MTIFARGMLQIYIISQHSIWIIKIMISLVVNIKIIISFVISSTSDGESDEQALP